MTEDGEGYVHDPAGFDAGRGERGDAARTGRPDGERDRVRRRADDEGEGGAGEDGTARGRDAAAAAPTHPDAEDREFGWRGWVLVGFVLVAFLVVPGVLLALPYAAGVTASFGLSFRDAYLVLPLVPALVLGALAVWATTRP